MSMAEVLTGAAAEEGLYLSVSRTPTQAAAGSVIWKARLAASLVIR